MGLKRIEDLNEASEYLIRASMGIVPEKRFSAFKIAVETLYKDHRVYKEHKITKKVKLIGLSGDE
jgi:hypothetical protein